jgi:hypothetical protein
MCIGKRTFCPKLMSFVKDMKKVAEKHAVAGLVVSSAGRF